MSRRVSTYVKLEAARLYDGGEKWVAICAQLGIAPSTLYRILREAGRLDGGDRWKKCWDCGQPPVPRARRCAHHQKIQLRKRQREWYRKKHQIPKDQWLVES